MGRRKQAKAARPAKRGEQDIVEPTPEQMRGAVFDLATIVDKGRGGAVVRIGKAFRRRPMIEILWRDGVLSEDEYKALGHYRHHADIADRSPLRDSLVAQRGAGSGMGPTVAVLNARRVRDDCERAAGSLADILRAVVVYDCSLSQWAMATSGAIEERYDRKGKTVVQLKPRRAALQQARLEIVVAAQRVQAELDA